MPTKSEIAEQKRQQNERKKRQRKNDLTKGLVIVPCKVHKNNKQRLLDYVKKNKLIDP